MMTIFDLGMHNGLDAEFYLRKGFKVVSVEANPYCCAYVKEHLCQYITSGQLVIIDRAIVDNIYQPTIEFVINKTHGDWGSLNSKWNSRYPSETEMITVDTISVITLLALYGDIYYIKSDLEGFDDVFIRRMAEYYKNVCWKPQFVSVELLTYNNISPIDSSSELFFILKSMGYNKFQLIDQSLNELVICPHPSLEGEYVDFTFSGYSSGLFGKELPNKWVSMDVALKQYLDYFYNKTHPNSWFDLHCCYD